MFDISTRNQLRYGNRNLQRFLDADSHVSACLWCNRWSLESLKRSSSDRDYRCQHTSLATNVFPIRSLEMFPVCRITWRIQTALKVNLASTLYQIIIYLVACIGHEESRGFEAAMLAIVLDSVIS